VQTIAHARKIKTMRQKQASAIVQIITQISSATVITGIAVAPSWFLATSNHAPLTPV
jgi:hypothetical protein